MKRTSALLTLIIPAAPNPWNTRAVVRDSNESDRAQASDAKVNTNMPT